MRQKGRLKVAKAHNHNPKTHKSDEILLQNVVYSVKLNIKALIIKRKGSTSNISNETYNSVYHSFFVKLGTLHVFEKGVSTWTTSRALPKSILCVLLNLLELLL